MIINLHLLSFTKRQAKLFSGPQREPEREEGQAKNNNAEQASRRGEAMGLRFADMQGCIYMLAIIMQCPFSFMLCLRAYSLPHAEQRSKIRLGLAYEIMCTMYVHVNRVLLLGPE